MHTVELLECALEYAESIGYRVRQEWLGGTGGGACEFRGQKWIFLDISLNVSEQLALVMETLRGDPEVSYETAPRWLQRYLGARRAA